MKYYEPVAALLNAVLNELFRRGISKLERRVSETDVAQLKVLGVSGMRTWLHKMFGIPEHLITETVLQEVLEKVGRSYEVSHPSEEIEGELP